MSASAVNAGALVTLQELNPSSPNFKPGGAFRVTGKWLLWCVEENIIGALCKQCITYGPVLDYSSFWLQEYTLETAVAVIVDGNANLKVDTQHLKLNLRPGSLYQFIGELHIEPSNEAILKARVGRNVDGLDLNLYHQSMQLLREFQAAQISSWAT